MTDHREQQHIHPDSPQEREREAFEAWAKNECPGLPLERWNDGYSSQFLTTAWVAWQACAAAKDARITELEKLAAAISCDCNDTALQRNEAYARIAALESQLAKAQAEVEGYEYILDCEVIAARKYEQPHHRAAPLGWICSRCGASHALWVSECNCPPPVKVTYSSGTGEEPK